MTKLTMWDLDNTLGTFDPIAKREYDKIKLRPGVKKILEDNQKRGTINVLTTNATRDYAEIALSLGKIKEYFELIFPRDVVMAYDGKKYRDVLAIYGIPPEEAIHKATVIGDLPHDRPIDVPGLTFILDSTYRNQEAEAADLRKVLENLSSHQSIAEGFDEIYANAEQHPEGYRVIKNGLKSECAINKGGEPEIRLIMLSRK